MKRHHADLPLHYGTVPPWLASRMELLGGAIVEAIVMEYGQNSFLQRLSDPFWFQSFGCVLGMDWHSSGITTSVMNALKKAINKRSQDIGLYVCGGRGNSSRQTPEELLRLGNATGLNGEELVRTSKLAAKIDNTAVQDGYQLYLHNFIVTNQGEWAIVQQGMNSENRMARRYHWLSSHIKDFMEEPHTSVCGKNKGLILNLTDKLATSTKEGILQLTTESPARMMREVNLIMPRHHDVRKEDVNMKRLGAALTLAHESEVQTMEELLLIPGVGPRTVQSLTLVSEVIHGTPSRFTDPARFSFAHGGKDGHPFPVPLKVYDETIEIFDKAIHQAKLGEKEKSDALRSLSKVSQQMEKSFVPRDFFDDWVQHERDTSYKYKGKTVYGDAKKPKEKGNKGQLSLWDE
ncbi:DUF763 domain-containing protein [Bacteroidales bacterium OttesenSCG-928-M06]|nr:DUF763 domain-containing protein [Bacteroidales bacterium OttesenSCG-928-M06]